MLQFVASFFRLLEVVAKFITSSRNAHELREREETRQKAKAWEHLSKAVKARRRTRFRIGRDGVFDDGYRRKPDKPGDRP